MLGYRTGSEFKNNIFITSDNQSIIYPAGNVIVIDNAESKPQRFIQCFPGSLGISCMTTSKSRKWLAWAEMGDNPCIVIVDLKGKDDKKYKIL